MKGAIMKDSVAPHYTFPVCQRLIRHFQSGEVLEGGQQKRLWNHTL